MKTQMLIQTTPAEISFNFEALRADLAEHLKQYDIVVTGDNVAGAKSLATDLNKQAGALDERRKAAIAKVSAPIKEADDQMRELIGMYKDGRARILDQVKVFEDETRALAGRLLHEHRQATWNALGVRPEFYRAEFDDLAGKLTSVTKAGNLTGGAAGELERRCRDDLSHQERIDRRLLELENRSYRAGLKAPLTRDHVASYLAAPEDEYEAALDRILKSEVARQEQIEAAERERQERKARADKELAAKLEKEAADKAAQAPQEPAPAEHAPAPDPEPEPAPAPPPAENGKAQWNVECMMAIECSARIPAAAIENELRRLLKAAGITTLVSVTARPATQEA